MNPQPEPYVGNIVASLLFLLMAFYTIKEMKSGKRSINLSDNFILGYIEDTPINVAVHVPKQQVITKTKTKKIVVEKPSFESQQLYVDCIDALVALGMKKKQAREKAKYIFSSMDTQPSSIQDFLQLALKMPS
jgi:hypothetical protein